MVYGFLLIAIVMECFFCNAWFIYYLYKDDATLYM